MKTDDNALKKTKTKPFDDKNVGRKMNYRTVFSGQGTI